MALEYKEYNSDSISEDSEAEAWSSNSQTSSEGNISWISWWCAHPGHEYFTEVPEEFIEDDFNMTGLSSLVSLYRESLELILDLEPDDDNLGAAEQESVEAASELLYGLVHQRYINSRNGLVAMAEKYESGHFGVCPRVLCNKTAVLPIGLSDVLEEESVKLYCPTCLDVYNPPNSRFSHVDGAFFGTTFPHLFFMTFPELLPKLPKDSLEYYVPRIYGFKVSGYARSGPRMVWLRQFMRSAHSDEEHLKSDDDTAEAMVGDLPTQQQQQQINNITSPKTAQSPSSAQLQMSKGSRPLVAVKERV